MPSNTDSKTILLKAAGERVRKELLAAGAITPGMVVDRDSSGEWAFRSSADLGLGHTYFADVADQIGSDIATAYSSGDQVKVFIALAGDEVYALVAIAHAAIAVGDLLQTADDGTLKAASTGTLGFRAMEAVDNSGGSAVARIRVEVL